MPGGWGKAMARLLFEGIFEVVKADPDGKKFEKGDSRNVVENICVQYRHGLHLCKGGDEETPAPSAVSRYECLSDLFDMKMNIDVNTELYPLQERDKVTVALVSDCYSALTGFTRQCGV